MELANVVIAVIGVIVTVVLYFTKQSSDKTYDLIKSVEGNLRVTEKKTNEIEVNYLKRFEHLGNVIHGVERSIIDRLEKKLDAFKDTVVAEQAEMREDFNSISGQLSQLKTEHDLIHGQYLKKKD